MADKIDPQGIEFSIGAGRASSSVACLLLRVDLRRGEQSLRERVTSAMRRTAVLSLSRVAVVTGNSVSGRACVQRLLLAQQETTVRACCRSEEKLQETMATLPTVAGDPSRLEGMAGVDADDASSLSAAFEGSEAAVIVTPLDYGRGFAQDADFSINMIRAAMRENVKRVIHVGSWTTAYPELLPGLAARFVPTEEFLQGSPEVPPDLEWTVLRGGYFLNNLVRGAPSSFSLVTRAPFSPLTEPITMALSLVSPESRHTCSDPACGKGPRP